MQPHQLRAGEESTGHHAEASTSSPAVAKAKLLTIALNAASRAQLTTTAHALLAHLVADAWLQDDGWTSHTPQSTLATRLNVHVGTIVRAIAELRDLVEYRPGQGHRRSRFVIRPVPAPMQGPVPAPAQGPSQRQRGEVPAPARGSTPRQRRDIPVNSVLSSSSSTAAPAAGGSIVEVKPVDAHAIDALAKVIGTRPVWLKAELPWVEPGVARELARLSTTSIDAVHWAAAIAHESRNTIRSPAALFVKRLRAPDLAEIDRRRRRREEWELKQRSSTR